MAHLKPLKPVNGLAILVNMFRHLDPKSREQFYKKLENANPLYAKVIDQFEFIYNDLVRLEDHSMQHLLTLIPEKDWLLAWKLSSQQIKHAIMRNLPDNNRKTFYDSAENQSKALKTKVISTQAKIAYQALKLLRLGKLKLRCRAIKIPTPKKHGLRAG